MQQQVAFGTLYQEHYPRPPQACSNCGAREDTGLIEGLCTPCFCKAYPPEAKTPEVHKEEPKDTALIPRDTIADIVTHRNEAVRLYGEFFAALAQAHDLKLKAEQVISDCMGKGPRGRRGAKGLNSYSGSHERELETFNHAIEPPDPETHSRVARRLVDIQFWGHVLERTDLETLMDRTAKDELRQQMRYIPERVDQRSGQIINQDEIDKALPPVTEDGILETLSQFTEDAGAIWRRGIAKAFSALDRRFRSHDGFKIGDRIILTNAFSEWGGWSYSSNHRDTLIDIERVFLVLDGQKPTAAYAGIVGAVDEARKHRSAHQSCTEGDYFRVRGFKNGNAHLWMTRKDLVVKINRLLAEYYGAGLGWGKAPREETDDDAFVGAMMRPIARNYGMFATPDSVAEKVIDAANLFGDTPLHVLEPSAGTGRLAKLALDSGSHWETGKYPRNRVDAVELQSDLATKLQESGLYSRVYAMDFLEMVPAALYDRVIMNPPFDRDRWADHVHHAMKFLKPGGRFVAIVPQCAEFSQSKKARAIRKQVDALAIEKPNQWGWGGPWSDLPAGSFADSGTYVNTMVLAFTSKRPINEDEDND